MGDVKELKKTITAHWNGVFPDLAVFQQMKLYKVLGPFIIGIELVELPGRAKYRPHFVVYALWGNRGGNDLEHCLTGPILLKEFKDKKGMQYSIPYEGEHSDLFADAVNSIHSQLSLSFTGDVLIDSLFELFDGYSQSSPLRASPYSYFQAVLDEVKIKTALYASYPKIKIEGMLEEARTKPWDLEHFKMCSISFDEWFLKLSGDVEHPSQLLDTILANSTNKKLKKLQRSEVFA